MTDTQDLWSWKDTPSLHQFVSETLRLNPDMYPDPRKPRRAPDTSHYPRSTPDPRPHPRSACPTRPAAPSGLNPTQTTAYRYLSDAPEQPCVSPAPQTPAPDPGPGWGAQRRRGRGGGRRRGGARSDSHHLLSAPPSHAQGEEPQCPQTNHTSNSSLLCPVCQRDFRSLQSLNGHLRSHGGLRGVTRTHRENAVRLSLQGGHMTRPLLPPISMVMPESDPSPSSSPSSPQSHCPPGGGVSAGGGVSLQTGVSAGGGVSKVGGVSAGGGVSKGRGVSALGGVLAGRGASKRGGVSAGRGVSKGGVSAQALVSGGGGVSAGRGLSTGGGVTKVGGVSAGRGASAGRGVSAGGGISKRGGASVGRGVSKGRGVSVGGGASTGGGASAGRGVSKEGGVSLGGVVLAVGGVSKGGGVSAGRGLSAGGGASKRGGMSVGGGASIGKGISAGGGLSKGGGVSAGRGVSVGRGVAKGGGVSVGGGASVGRGVSKGGGVSVGEGASVGRGVSKGGGVSVGGGASVGRGISKGGGLSVGGGASVGRGVSKGGGVSVGRGVSKGGVSKGGGVSVGGGASVGRGVSKGGGVSAVEGVRTVGWTRGVKRRCHPSQRGVVLFTSLTRLTVPPDHGTVSGGDAAARQNGSGAVATGNGVDAFGRGVGAGGGDCDGTVAGGDRVEHYTPPPMLCPVREGPGLYCSLLAPRGQQGAHTVDLDNTPSILDDLLATVTEDSRKQKIIKPRINIGVWFQADIPPLKDRRHAPSNPHNAQLLWSPWEELEGPVTQQRVEALRMMSQSTVMPGGGASSEHALHVLSEHRGDFLLTLDELLQPGSSKHPPSPLIPYHYTGSVRWTSTEKRQATRSFRLHRKDFSRMQTMVRTKSLAQCVEYYYLWKKKRHGARTLIRLSMSLPDRKDDVISGEAVPGEIDNRVNQQATSICQSVDLAQPAANHVTGHIGKVFNGKDPGQLANPIKEEPGL